MQQNIRKLTSGSEAPLVNFFNTKNTNKSLDPYVLKKHTQVGELIHLGRKKRPLIKRTNVA